MRRLTEDRSRCVLHMQKALTEMIVKLDSVIANITGLTGQRILRAIIDGERDPERLATLRHRGIKADANTIAASLQGTWREEHLFAVEQPRGDARLYPALCGNECVRAKTLHDR